MDKYHIAKIEFEPVLPWRSKDLSPNARVNWRRRAEATKTARQMAVVLALGAGWREVCLPEGRLHLWLDFYQASGKKLPDDDNMPGRCKAYRDGIAQVLGIDDKRFKSHPDVKTERRPGGQVVVRITGGPEAAAQQQEEQGNAG
jgi:crossover junction endodeoxyribonuclease RusA